MSSSLSSQRPSFNEVIAKTKDGKDVIFTDEMNKFIDDLIYSVDGEDLREVGGAGQPDFQNGWVNFGGTTRTLAFKKIGSRVFFKGVIKSGAMNDLTLPVLTLPSGYYVDVHINIATMSDSEVVRVNISPSGDLTLFGADSSPSFVLMEFSYLV